MSPALGLAAVTAEQSVGDNGPDPWYHAGHGPAVAGHGPAAGPGWAGEQISENTSDVM